VDAGLRRHDDGGVEMTQILKGIRVLDVTRYVAGPIATALLADLGADVIRIEPPGGGDDRAPLPFAEGFHGGVGFTQAGRNKRGLTLDLGCARGREVFEKLLLTVDVVAVNMPPRAIKSLGLDYDRLRAIKPDIILLHLTTFGTEGPYADRLGFDAIAQVMSGLTAISGESGKPMKSAAAWVDMSTGFIGAFGVMAALRHRDATGEGQKVEANLLQNALTVGNYFLIDQAFNQYDRKGTANRAPSGAPADLVPTKDGWVYVVALGNPMFKRFARMVGREAELTGDPRYQSDESRATHGEALSGVAEAWSAKLTTAAALAELAKFNIPAGPLLTMQQALDDPHVAGQFVQQVEVEGLSKPVPFIRSPATFSKTPAEIHKGPPAPGEDNGAVLAEAGFSSEEIEKLREEKVIYESGRFFEPYLAAPQKILRFRCGASHRWVTPRRKGACRLTHPTPGLWDLGRVCYAASLRKSCFGSASKPGSIARRFSTSICAKRMSFAWLIPRAPVTTPDASQ
jgi:crotonobetainyl-CoA:carnitine CoA-transferase CaiB-like acyl-CoA transferase